MSLPTEVSAEEWRAARITKRRELPMVRIDKDYIFEGPDGTASLLDLFDGRRQLIVGHFMFSPEWNDGGGASCSAGADEIPAGLFDHLHIRGTRRERRSGPMGPAGRNADQPEAAAHARSASATLSYRSNTLSRAVTWNGRKARWFSFVTIARCPWRPCFFNASSSACRPAEPR